MDLPDRVHIDEVMPRDGLQRLASFVPTERKVDLVDDLVATGLESVEVTAFSHPDAVPNLRDADDLFERLDRRDGVAYHALVPNRVGAERAVAAGVDGIDALVTVSDAYARKNQGMTSEENLDALDEILDVADDAGISVEAGLSTSFFCPYRGRVDPERTLAVAERAVEAGVDAVSFSATAGMADPRRVDDLLARADERLGLDAIDAGLHLHDTNGLALANAVTAMRRGIQRFDAAVCGLGGGTVFPDGLENVGNVPTEDLVAACDAMGVETGVDLDALLDVARSVRDDLGLAPWSHALAGGTPATLLRATGGVDEE
jgi:hydroxymethylglutaryl-CoA lyase